MKHQGYFIGNIHEYNETSAWQYSVQCVYGWSNLHHISNKQQSLITVGDNFCFRIAHYKLDQTENQISWDKL